MQISRATVLLVAVFIILTLQAAYLSTIVCADVIDNVLNLAKKVGYYKGNTNILILTNLGYVNGSDKYINDFLEKSGAILGKNIVFVHSSYWKPLWFAFFNKLTGECLYIEVRGGKIVKVSEANISISFLFTHPGEWSAKMNHKIFDGNEFSIITIANAWAHNAPYLLLKCAEFHNHLCPGLISGYLIVEYLMKNFPPKKGEYYIVFAVPPWCKDDCIQVLLDSTVGKRMMYVKMLSKEQIEHLPRAYRDIAGIYVIWNRTAERGIAVILGFNWTKVRRIAGVGGAIFRKYRWLAKLKEDLVLIRYLDRPELFVHVIKKFRIDRKTLNELAEAGVNPLVVLGIIKSAPSQSYNIEAIIPFIVAGIAITALAVILVSRRRKKTAQQA